MTRLYPAVREPLRSLRRLHYFRRRLKRFQDEFCSLVYGTEPIHVLCGPFAGMQYFNQVVWGPITPKWIGSFESELCEVVGEVVSRRYDSIVDIGAAEGYYAVGLARTLPESRVRTYDIDFIARRRQRALAALNGVSARVAIRGRCSHALLQDDLKTGSCLVISDSEGAELELIDPSRVANLARSDILVECHRTECHSVADVASAIARRFKHTHRVITICSEPRVAAEWAARHPRLACVDGERLAVALDELRYPQMWLWMTR